MQSASPGRSGEDSDQGSPDVHLHTSGLHPHRGKHPGRRSVSLPRDSRLAALSLSVPGDLGKMGRPIIDLFASNASKQTQRFFSWDASDNPEGVDTLYHRWDFSLAYAFPQIALLKKLETSKGTFILVSPLWEAQTWLASLLMLKVLEVCRLPFMQDLVTDLKSGKPPPTLHNLHLVAWKICGGSTPSRTSLATPEISTWQGGAHPQRIDTKEPGRPSKDIFIPPTQSSWCEACYELYHSSPQSETFIQHYQPS
jgi:hypothetical protein